MAPLKIRVARSAGFCFGVRRAIEIALEAAGKQADVYMLGDIVHNECVVDQIKKAGIRVVDSIDDIAQGVLLLRAHGTMPDVYAEAERRGLRVVDATCPMVLEIHRIVRSLADEGYQVVIIGDQNHDEVRGIAGQAENALVVSSPADLDGWQRRFPASASWSSPPRAWKTSSASSRSSSGSAGSSGSSTPSASRPPTTRARSAGCRSTTT
jgi:(E)-4-hydroxy-3-methyl-but-2-enyl pyrophosphate reductase